MSLIDTGLGLEGLEIMLGVEIRAHKSNKFGFGPTEFEVFIMTLKAT